MTTYFLPQDEIILWKGNLPFLLATGEQTSAIVDFDQVESYALYIAGAVAATYKLEAQVAGQWIEFASGSLVAFQMLVLYDVGPVPPSIRLKLTPSVDGRFFATCKVYKDRYQETTITSPSLLPTLPWVVTSVVYLPVGVTGTVYPAPVTTHIINSAGADNMNVDVTSATQDIRYYEHIALEITVVNDNLAAGYIYIQVSESGAAWDNVTFNDGSYRIEVRAGVDILNPAQNLNLDLNSKYVRVFYDRTGGNGQLDVWLTRK